MEKIKLTYFDFDGGRAEPTRIAMSMGGIEFEDCRLSFAQFAEMRADTPLNAVPVVEINGVEYTQCNAMNRYFGKRADLYPTDPWQAFLCDEAMEIIEDTMHALIRTFGMQGDELKAARIDLSNGIFLRCLKILNTRLEAAGGEYFADHRLTVADLKVYLWVRHLKSGALDHISSDLPDSVAPRLVQHMERVAAEPGVLAYYAGRAK